MNAPIRPNQLPFREALRQEFTGYLREQEARFAPNERLKLDLHCHDLNSDVPDELWGRILGLRETWLPTDDLVRCLKRNGSDVVTITNHNNTRSCWQLLDAGRDVLVGAEFTCTFPEYELYVHVLTYGFTPEQEAVLNKKRKNVYEFCRYAAEHDIPLVLPHPLYFYARNPLLNLELFEKMAVMFQRFEVLNGNRDLWQSVLLLNWTRGLTEEKIHDYGRKHALDPRDFGVLPHQPKVLTGGSDDHMGVTAGDSGSYLWVPDLDRRRAEQPLSALALQAIRLGRMAPYGHVGENQRLSVALLDYFTQIATRIEDPGLLRLALHRGDLDDKLWCLLIGNALLEMKKHKTTQRFITVLHDALHGKRPGWFTRMAVSSDYRFCIEQLDRIADARANAPDTAPAVVHEVVHELFSGLCQLIVKRVQKCVGDQASGVLPSDLSSEALVKKLEVPIQLTALAFGAAPQRSSDNITGVNVAELLDKLSFPVIMSGVLAGSQLASTRVLYGNRGLLNNFAARLGSHQHNLQHPRRALWLTDTLRDRNGVSNSLSGKLAEMQRSGYAVDFLVCHPEAQGEPHLHVVKPVAEFSFPNFGEQVLRVPDLLQVARIFYEGGYDRIVCSTEGPMVLVALFLKAMFNVPSFFFMHTDWLDFFKHTTSLDVHERDRIRRLMRALYQQFDGVFVLNTDHYKWLTSSQIGLKKKNVFLTAHHVERPRGAVTPVQKAELIQGATDATPVMFYAGRVSREKGVMELPGIYRKALEQVPNLKLVVAGTGPALEELKKAVPEATFTGWVDRARIAQLYAGLDLFVFPSKFDTFGNVVLEAFSFGMPVLAYKCKGPKDIVRHGVNGYLVNTQDEMAAQVVAHFKAPERHAPMCEAARRRIEDYGATTILTRFLYDLGLIDAEGVIDERAVA